MDIGVYKETENKEQKNLNLPNYNLQVTGSRA